MRLIDQISLNQLRIFESVYRTKSMTKAADELNLTQSGISQHMKSLEDCLQVQLFDRIKQKLVPTSAGRELFNVCHEKLIDLENGLQRVSFQKEEISGEVVIGVPAEFGINVVVPIVARFLREHPGVLVRVLIDLADAMNEMLLRGDIDFAFVDDFKMDGRIHIRRVYDEHLDLCYSKHAFPDLHVGQDATRKFFESLPYIGYKEDFPVLQNWFAHHYNMRRLNLNLRASVSDVPGVARFIAAGVGLGVLPRHNIRKLQLGGEPLAAIPTKTAPLVNTISIATLSGKSQPAVSTMVQTYLLTEIEKLNSLTEN